MLKNQVSQTPPRPKTSSRLMSTPDKATTNEHVVSVNSESPLRAKFAAIKMGSPTKVKPEVVASLSTVVANFDDRDLCWHIIASVPNKQLCLAHEKLEAKINAYIEEHELQDDKTYTAMANDISSVIFGSRGVYYMATHRDIDNAEQTCYHIAHTIIYEAIHNTKIKNKDHLAKSASILKTANRLCKEIKFVLLLCDDQELNEVLIRFNSYLRLQAKCLALSISYWIDCKTKGNPADLEQYLKKNIKDIDADIATAVDEDLESEKKELKNIINEWHGATVLMTSPNRVALPSPVKRNIAEVKNYFADRKAKKERYDELAQEFMLRVVAEEEEKQPECSFDFGYEDNSSDTVELSTMTESSSQTTTSYVIANKPKKEKKLRSKFKPRKLLSE